MNGMDIEKKYIELKNFLISYFGDYWEGKTELEILKVAVAENTNKYIALVKKMLKEFVSDPNYSTREKGLFIRNANLQFRDDQEAMLWFIKLSEILEDSNNSKNRLLVIAASGAGKSTVRQYIQNLPEFHDVKIGEVDDYLNMTSEDHSQLATLKGKEREDYWTAIEIAGSQKAIADNLQVCFTVGGNEKILKIFEDNGFNIVVLDLPEEELLKRIQKRGTKIQVKEAVNGLYSLRKLPYPRIDANTSTAEIAVQIIRYL